MALFSYLTAPRQGDGHLTNLPIRFSNALVDDESGIKVQKGSP
jgi:hypothetical protein